MLSFVRCNNEKKDNSSVSFICAHVVINYRVTFLVFLFIYFCFFDKWTITIRQRYFLPANHRYFSVEKVILGPRNCVRYIKVSAINRFCYKDLTILKVSPTLRCPLYLCFTVLGFNIFKMQYDSKDKELGYSKWYFRKVSRHS